MVAVFLFIAVVAVAVVAFFAGTSYRRLRQEADEEVDTTELPERVGRPEFTGYHTPLSRYMQGHPPEPGEPRAR